MTFLHLTPLHWIGQNVRDLLLLIPLPVVRALFLSVPLLLLLWVWSLPREATTPPGETDHRGGNLKTVATVALLIQIAVYCVL